MTSQLLQDFPELSHLTREDFEDLLNDPTYFQEVFHSLRQVKELYNGQMKLGMANEAVAKDNLSLQQLLYDLRSESKDAFDDAKRLESRWKELEKEQREVYQRFAPQFLLLRLRHSVTAQDEKSEALASSFIQQNPIKTPDGDVGTSKVGQDIEEFIRAFKESRKIYHKRALWVEKWASGHIIWRDD